MNKEQEDLVVNNMGLAYKITAKYYSKVQFIYEYEDAQQVCLEGLINAATTFDATKGFSFSTYAYTVIKHHLFKVPIQEIKKRENSYVTSISSLDVLLQDEESTLLDMVADTFDLEAEQVSNSSVELLYGYINELDTQGKTIMLMRCKNKTFKEIADVLGLNVSSVQRNYKKALNILRYKFRLHRGDYFEGR